MESDVTVVDNVVHLSDAKRRFMEQLMKKTPEQLYYELLALRNQVDQLNSEILRLHREMRDYE